MDEDKIPCQVLPLQVPKALKERLNVRRYTQELYQTRFQRLSRSYRRFIECFGKTIQRDTSARFTLSVTDQMLTYSPDPLPVSLLKIKRNGRAHCLELFKHVLRWMSLSNATDDIELRNVELQKIVDITDSDPRLRDEIHLQALKQTRGCPDRNTERNAWKLFSLVLATLSCSLEMTKFIATYLHTAAIRYSKDPLMNKFITEMTDSLRNSSLASPKTLKHLPDARTDLGRFYCFPVYFSDDSHVDAVYDAATVIEDLVPQLAWTIGLPDDESFALYECRGAQYTQIDRKRLATAVISDISDRRTEDQPSRLFMKRTKSSRPSMEGLDRDSIYRMYLETKDRYRRGGYPMAAVGEVAMRICVFLIQAEGAAELFENKRRLSGELNNFIPSTSLGFKQREELIDGVLTKFAHIGRIDIQAARLQFLDAIEGLCYRLG